MQGWLQSAPELVLLGVISCNSQLHNQIAFQCAVLLCRELQVQPAGAAGLAALSVTLMYS
jgi:hypothetical protein